MRKMYIRSKTMAIVLTAALSGTLAGCGATTLTVSNETAEAITTEAATEAPSETTTEEPTTENPAAKTANNVTCKFDESTGVLEISGTGDITTSIKQMYTYPWDSYTQSIKSIVISEGITAIGDSAFSGCSNLKEVEIPESVTSIGDQAFDYCESLVSAKIPEGVTSIGTAAFESAAALKILSFLKV